VLRSVSAFGVEFWSDGVLEILECWVEENCAVER
jgi:hypothetical protein